MHFVAPVLSATRRRLSLFGWWLAPGRLYELDSEDDSEDDGNDDGEDGDGEEGEGEGAEHDKEGGSEGDDEGCEDDAAEERAGASQQSKGNKEAVSLGAAAARKRQRR